MRVSVIQEMRSLRVSVCRERWSKKHLFIQRIYQVPTMLQLLLQVLQISVNAERHLRLKAEQQGCFQTGTRAKEKGMHEDGSL